MKKPALKTLIAIVVVLWLVSGISIAYFSSTTEKASQFGDMFGAVNALFSGLAFAGLIFTIQLQKEELALQRQELADTREELKGQKEQLALQNETMSKQQFEATFFQLLRVFNEYIGSMQMPIMGATLVGHRVLEQLCERLRGEINKEMANPTFASNSIEGNYVGAFARFMQGHERQLGPYFRLIYNLLKFVNNSGISEKRRYTNILRAQLSNTDLFLLYFDCISQFGRVKLRPLVEEYGLLKHGQQMFQNLSIITTGIDKKAFE